jgi:hypothetical protein
LLHLFSRKRREKKHKEKKIPKIVQPLPSLNPCPEHRPLASVVNPIPGISKKLP